MPPADATRSVALLGPTNTGKTHRAVERMLEFPSGMIGLPLRLLAREIYDRISARIGEDRVALVTGEEKRIPRRAAYWVCTTEAMPLTREVDFIAVDEVQLATHDERGHVFTDRLLHARGREETWFLGASTMRGIVERLVPAAQHREQARLSRLSFAGSSKLSRLRPRTAVVAFSVKELYELAGRLRSLRGGTAVVLGALSPRTRNAQVALFQSGEVDYLVATDSIGMGLNLDLEHVAFASLRKFDGRNARALEEAEIAQIAGRAGRFTRDGTFGTVLPLELEKMVATRVEEHRFEPIRRVRFRNSELDFSSSLALVDSLKKPPLQAYLASVPAADDLRALEALIGHPAVKQEIRLEAGLRRLWDVCQIPDFRKILFEVHLELLRALFVALSRGPLDDAFLAAHVDELDRLDGDVDTLMARIGRLRTWAFVANQGRWVEHAEAWQMRLSELEDRLSDALHASLVERFVERSSRKRPVSRSQQRRRLEEDTVAPDDAHHPFAALAALRGQLAQRAPGPAPLAPGSDLEALVDASHEAFAIDANGSITAAADGTPLARLSRGSSISSPEVRLLALDELGAGLRQRLQRRLLAFARDFVSRLLGPIHDLARTQHGALGAIAYQLDRGLGTASTAELAASLAALDSEAMGRLAALGVRVGRLTVHAPPLLRPRCLAQRAILLRAFRPAPAIPGELGRPSYARGALDSPAWLAIGYVPTGPRVLRADLAERSFSAIEGGEPSRRVLGSLGVPRSEQARVERALVTACADSSA